MIPSNAKSSKLRCEAPLDKRESLNESKHCANSFRCPLICFSANLPPSPSFPSLPLSRSMWRLNSLFMFRSWACGLELIAEIFADEISESMRKQKEVEVLTGWSRCRNENKNEAKTNGLGWFWWMKASVREREPRRPFRLYCYSILIEKVIVNFYCAISGRTRRSNRGENNNQRRSVTREFMESTSHIEMWPFLKYILRKTLS